MVLAMSRLHTNVSQAVKRRQVETTSPRLSVVIVNYHRWADTAALVQQLRASRAMRGRQGEVLIVDNHSPTHPALRLLRRCSGVSLRRWGRNRGFARAVNEGCRLSQGDWILLLNPDMSVREGFLDQVVALTEEMGRSQPRAGIIGLRLLDPEGSPQHSAGPFPSLLGTLARLLLPRSRRKYSEQPRDRSTQVDWVTGCGMLIRRECLDQLGGLDASFFLYYEDVDLCRRARALGWEVWYTPNIEAVHHHPLHRRRIPPALRVVTRHSLLTYARKHWPNWQFHWLCRLVGAEAGLRQFWAGWRGDHRAQSLFGELGQLSKHLATGRVIAARRCLHALIDTQHFYEDRRD